MKEMDTPPTHARKPLVNSLSKNSVTPCRRVGLGRPSSGSLTKLVQVRTMITPAHSLDHVDQNRLSAIVQKNTLETSDCDSTSNEPCIQNDGHHKEVVRVRRCLTHDLNIRSPFDKKAGKSDINQSETDNSFDSYGVKSSIKSSSKIKKFKSDSSQLKICKKIPVTGGHQDKSSVISKTESTNMFGDDSKVVTEETIEQLLISILEKKKKIEQLKMQKTCVKKDNLKELQVQSATWRAAGQEALRHCVRLARQAGYSVTIQQLMVQHGFPPALMGYNSDDDEFD